MTAAWLLICLPGAIFWLVVLLLPWRPWSTRERLEAVGPTPTSELDEITVLIPARNEAARIGRTLAAVRRQDLTIAVVVVDDRSDDGTADAARACGLDGLRLITGQPLPEGWSGKLWALEQGLAEVRSRYTLLLDADIELDEGILAKLLEHLQSRDLRLASLMATLSMKGFWEKLLMPAFIYFFKLLYPFRLSNSSNPWVAAAAGGCILVETAVLREIGGFKGIRGELIDDCALAARVKASGHRIWIGLSRSVSSHRRYPGLAPVWSMVARTAYTQLRYSPWLLAGCVLALTWAFWWPVVGLFSPQPVGRAAAVTAIAAMISSYLPTLRYYGLSPLWALLLPLSGTLYLAMTVDSARRYYGGERSRWRGRIYAADRVSK